MRDEGDEGPSDRALRCPWCGELADVWIDEGAGANQSYVEDCAVCCRPCVITVAPGDDGTPIASIERE